MLLSALGASALMSSSTAMGFLISQRYKSRVKQLKQFHSALLALEVRQSYLEENLYFALAGIAQEEPVKEFFQDLRKNLEIEKSSLGMKVHYPGEAWKKTIEQWRERLDLTDEDWSVLQDLGHTLGTPDKVTGVNFLHYVLERLKEQEKQARDEQKMEKAFKVGGFVIGAVATIILL